MKVSGLKFLVLSLPAVAVLFPYSANSALRVNNASLVQGQMYTAAQQAVVAQQPMTPQPARMVKNENGETVQISDAEMAACSAIYTHPAGQFDWVVPTMGTKSGSAANCTALVELRSYKDTGGTEYTVLAHGYLAAGDTVTCNVDNFPELTLAGKNFTYPADAEPTIEDVEAAMAQEQKVNAGWKILGAALVGGIGGNLLGKEDNKNKDKETPFGLNKEKLKTTALGAAGAAAVMTASTQSNNYKAGQIILSSGVNAVAGAAAGNLSGNGDDVLRIEDCVGKNLNGKCIVGLVTLPGKNVTFGEWSDPKKTNPEEDDKYFYFYNVTNGNTYRCTQKATPATEDENKYKECTSLSLINIQLDLKISTLRDLTENQRKECKDMSASQDIPRKCKQVLQASNLQGKAADGTADIKIYQMNNDSKVIEYKEEPRDGDKWIAITSAYTRGQNASAQIKMPSNWENKNKLFGYTRDYWDKNKPTSSADVYTKDGESMCHENGSIVTCENGSKHVAIDNFTPKTQSADDGDGVDFGNKARMKSTLIGGVGGAGLGALSANTGANAAIQERWQTSVREYQDSLLYVVCSTGDKWLGKYNDEIIIPEMKKTDSE